MSYEGVFFVFCGFSLNLYGKIENFKPCYISSPKVWSPLTRIYQLLKLHIHLTVHTNTPKS